MEPNYLNVEVPVNNYQIIRSENIPLEDFPEHYHALAISNQKIREENMAIKHLFETAKKENALLEKALIDNSQGDEKFAEGFEGAYQAAKEENALLKMEITHLKSQKIESERASEEKVKSLQELISEIELCQERIRKMEQVNAEYFKEIHNLKLCYEYVMQFANSGIQGCGEQLWLERLSNFRSILLTNEPNTYMQNIAHLKNNPNYFTCIIS